MRETLWENTRRVAEQIYAFARSAGVGEITAHTPAAQFTVSSFYHCIVTVIDDRTNRREPTYGTGLDIQVGAFRKTPDPSGLWNAYAAALRDLATLPEDYLTALVGGEALDQDRTRQLARFFISGGHLPPLSR